jgi:molybdopterin synthase sulfur carrier subunit
MSMADTLTVKLFADLGKTFGKRAELALDTPAPVLEVLEGLGVPREKAAIVLRNGRHVELTDTVNPGDTLSVFPPVGGG